jgi:pyridoxine 5'-phosphate synthase PdxJ
MPATGSTTIPRASSRASPDFVEFNIGHFLIGEAIFVGLETAIAVMRRAMDEGRAAG